MLHAELGRRPLYTNIHSRMIGFWISIINGKKNKLSNLLYSVLINESNNGNFVSKWIQTIKNILISVGKPNFFNATSLDCPKHIQNSIKNTLNDLYIQEWNAKFRILIRGRIIQSIKKKMA